MNTLLKALELSKLGEVSHATVRRLAIILVQRMRSQSDGHAALTLLSIESELRQEARLMAKIPKNDLRAIGERDAKAGKAIDASKRELIKTDLQVLLNESKENSKPSRQVVPDEKVAH